MNIINEMQLDFDNVSIMPKRSMLNSRSEVNLLRTFKWTSSTGNNHELTCIPIITANMGTVGTPSAAEYLTPKNYLVALEKHYKSTEICNLFHKLQMKATDECININTYTDRVALSIGIKESLDTLKEVSEKYKVNILNLDVPNGYCPNVVKRLTELRELFPEAFIIVGTVVTGDIVTDLIMKGANCVRLGICCGSVCTTSQKTGVRRPIISMLVECADAAHNLKSYVMLDGGVRYPADACKAFIAGADFIMSGSMFAGTDLAEGEIIEKWYKTNEVEACDFTEDGVPTFFKPIYKKKLFKLYYGMSSDLAQEKHFGGIKDYRTSEGREKCIPYIGSIDNVLKDLEGGLRSCCTYIGAKCIKDMPRHGTFYKVYQQINSLFEKCEDF